MVIYMEPDAHNESQIHTLEALLADVEAQIGSMRVKLSELDKQRELHLARIDQLGAEQRGLTLALQRLTGSDGHASDAESRPSEFANLTRTDAVEEILKSAQAAMSIKEITAVLAERGREDAYDLVSAALAYLKRKERVHQPRRGQWVIGPDPWELDDSPLSQQEWEAHNGA